MCRNWPALCSSGTLPATSSSSAPRMVCSESRNSSEEAARISAVLRVRSPPASGAPAAGRGVVPPEAAGRSAADPPTAPGRSAGWARLAEGFDFLASASGSSVSGCFAFGSAIARPRVVQLFMPGRLQAVGPLAGAFQILVQHLLAVAPVAARGAERNQQPLLLDPVERAQADAQVFHRVAGVEERVAARLGRQCGSVVPAGNALVVLI